MIWLAQANPAAAATPAATAGTWWWVIGIAAVALVAWWLWSPGRRQARAGGRNGDNRQTGDNAR